ncbi:MAG: ATP-binding protein [Acidimicrobiales bacterium]|nr:ATP-binding protein [Acidimicrobiales bacterium]
MIIREMTEELRASAAEFPAVTILGPRQSGKTTLAKYVFPDYRYISLEDPDTNLRAHDDPRELLSDLGDSGIIGEIQKVPDIASYLQGFIDSKRGNGRYILTGSNQPILRNTVSQSLAGRTAILELMPYSFQEIMKYDSIPNTYELIVKGSFPRVYEENIRPERFYNSYLQTYIERDVRLMVNVKDALQFQRFVTLLAARVGQLLNFESLSNDLGLSSTTLRNWFSVLKASYVIYELHPWYANIRKRLIKSSKVYFTDVGLAAFLVGIHNSDQLKTHPLRGNLYENLIVTEVLKGAFNKGVRPELYFFRDSTGNEIDLVVQIAGRWIPVEIKSSATFSKDFVKSMSMFKGLGVGEVDNGLVFYNGEANISYNGIPILNPLNIGTRSLWDVIQNPN